MKHASIVLAVFWACTVLGDNQELSSGANWWSKSREALFEPVIPAIKAGMNGAAVWQMIGDPSATLRVGDTNLATYGLSDTSFFHVLTDPNAKVMETRTTVYPLVSNFDAAVPSLRETRATEALLALGSWRALRGRGLPYADRTRMAASAAALLKPALSTNEVSALFGAPDCSRHRDWFVVWTYRAGASTFLQVIFSDKNDLLGAGLRHFHAESGRLTLVPLCGVVGQADIQQLDQDCWEAAAVGRKVANFRTGIALRMAGYIKTGMATSEVEGMLGEPTRRDEGGKVWRYATLPSVSFLTVAFDAKGRVASVASELFK